MHRPGRVEPVPTRQRALRHEPQRADGERRGRGWRETTQPLMRRRTAAPRTAQGLGARVDMRGHQHRADGSPRRGPPQPAVPMSVGTSRSGSCGFSETACTATSRPLGNRVDTDSAGLAQRPARRLRRLWHGGHRWTPPRVRVRERHGAGGPPPAPRSAPRRAAAAHGRWAPSTSPRPRQPTGGGPNEGRTVRREGGQSGRAGHDLVGNHSACRGDQLVSVRDHLHRAVWTAARRRTPWSPSGGSGRRRDGRGSARRRPSAAAPTRRAPAGTSASANSPSADVREDDLPVELHVGRGATVAVCGEHTAPSPARSPLERRRVGVHHRRAGHRRREVQDHVGVRPRLDPHRGVHDMSSAASWKGPSRPRPPPRRRSARRCARPPTRPAPPGRRGPTPSRVPLRRTEQDPAPPPRLPSPVRRVEPP